MGGRGEGAEGRQGDRERRGSTGTNTETGTDPIRSRPDKGGPTTTRENQRLAQTALAYIYIYIFFPYVYTYIYGGNETRAK